MTETTPFYFWETVSMRNISFLAGLGLGATTILASLTTSFSLPAQAQPSLPAYEYQEGRFSAEAQINPLAGRLLGRVLQQEVPSAVTFSATEMAGSFIIPQATARIADGTILLDASPVKAFLEPYLQQVLERAAQSYPVPEDLGFETLESVLNYRLIGQGWLNSAENESTAFAFEYRDGSDYLEIKGLEPSVLALCQVQECKTQVDGNFDLKLDLARLSVTSDELGLQLPSPVKRALKRAQLFGFKEVAFADGKLSSVLQISPFAEPGVSVPSEQPVLSEHTSSPPVFEFLDALEPSDSSAEVNQANVVERFEVGARSAEQVASDSFRRARLPSPPQTFPTKTRQTAAAWQGQNQLTHGNFVLSAERITAPWSIVFSVPSR